MPKPLSLSKQKSPSRRPLRGLMDRVVWRPLAALKEFPGNPRCHPESQIVALMKSIRRFWTNPILVDETGTILAGHGRLEAARRLAMTEVPTVTVSGLSDSDKRAVVIADNRLPEQAVWDFDLLRGHFQDLVKLDFDVELTGFSTGEVDLLIDGSQQPAAADPADDLVGLGSEGPAVSQFGDVWKLGRHRLVCGDAQRGETYERLLGGELAEMMVTEPSYSGAAFSAFLNGFIRNAVSASRDGAIHYIFMDWRHLPELLGAALPLYSEWKDVLVWNKSTAGQGSFYRSKHELITVFKSGTGPHVNNFKLGGKGRYRTNVLDYPGVISPHPARQGDLELHPTVKPVALIADLIRDCSRRSGIILDPFGGSGTTILAAERTGRIARVAELERWQKVTGLRARHETGLAFVDTEARPENPSPTSARSAQPQRRASRR
jgi:DNA modification methylase